MSAAAAAGLAGETPRRPHGQRCETCETQRGSTRIKVCLLLLTGFLSYLWYHNLTEADGRPMQFATRQLTTWLAPTPRPPAAPPRPPVAIARPPAPRAPRTPVAVVVKPVTVVSARPAVRRAREVPNPAPDLKGLY